MSNTNIRNMALAIASAACKEFEFAGYTALLASKHVFRVSNHGGDCDITFYGKPGNWGLECTSVKNGATHTLAYQPTRDGYPVELHMAKEANTANHMLNLATRLPGMLVQIMNECTVMGERKELFQGGSGHSSLEMMPAQRHRITSGASND